MGLLFLVVTVCAPRPTSAQGDRTATLRRAVSNAVFGPLDVALSPVVTAQTLYERGRMEKYSWPGIAALELIGGPGFFFPSNAAAGAFRTWAGLFEIPVGLGLLVSKSFTDWEPPALFDLHEEPALVDHPNDVIPVKFGVEYLGSGSG